MLRPPSIAFLAITIQCGSLWGQSAAIDFERDVAPILEKHCLHCHSDNISKGDLSLTSMRDLVEDELVVPHEPDESRLLDVVSGDEPEMPKEGEPLNEDEVDVIRQWVSSGAEWPDSVILRERSKGDTSWWSLRPIAPHHEGKSIDWFIEKRLAENGLRMNPPADRGTLIRRVTYDLIGLPPTPDEIESFIKDADPNAYERLVDRLLASPQYGERWGRHWLDVVRFGESNGYERNVLINNLWPFRDYVIRSFNEDKPFDQMIREHLAGDVVGPGDPDVEVGSAFLVAGPYDDVGNQDPVQKQQIRANTIDEMIRATGEAFLGLTIGCARCHDHKFDAIQQSDYYRLYATLSAVRHGSNVVATAEEKAERDAKVKPLEARKDELTKQRDDLNAAIQARAHENAETHERLWVRDTVDRTGTEERFEPTEAAHVRLICEGRETAPANPRGFQVDEMQVWSSGPQSKNVALASGGATASGPSRVIEDFPGAYGPQLAIDGKSGARFISRDVFLAIHLPEPTLIDRVVISSARGVVNPQQPKFHFVADYRIETSLDGEKWTEVASGRDRKPVNDAHRNHRLRNLEITAEEQKQIARLDREINQLTRQIRGVPALPSVWVGDRAGEASGPFHVFIGGSPQRKGEEVTPASLSFLSDSTPGYELGADSPESARRLALADWIVHEKNPLTPRVLANRVWHYHFGAGLVNTPSDFGFMGGRPSHPELLDWLATRLVAGGWRLKPFHKLIMMSSVYRQTSDHQTDAAKLDGDARLLWRFPPRRLSAEEIRDSMLSIAGRMDHTMGGPGFQLYRYLQDNVATYVPRDRHGPETFRRAVYHQNARATRVDLMTDFDQPDCAFSIARRAATTTPLQALTALNHSFTLEMSNAMAARLVSESGDDLNAQIRRAYLLCFGREATDEETGDCVKLVEEHGLAALCRVLLNTSELIYLL